MLHHLEHHTHLLCDESTRKKRVRKNSTHRPSKSACAANQLSLNITPMASNDESCIILGSDEETDDDIEITSAYCKPDDSVICIGSVVSQPVSVLPPFFSDGIEVLSETVNNRLAGDRIESDLPPVYIVNQMPNLEPTSDGVQVVSSVSRNLLSALDDLGTSNDLVASTLNGGGIQNTASKERRSRKGRKENYYTLQRELATSEARDRSHLIKCPICLEDIKSILNSNNRLMVTICGHIHCSNCIENVMRLDKQCSQCRKKLTKKQYHPLYL